MPTTASALVDSKLACVKNASRQSAHIFCIDDPPFFLRNSSSSDEQSPGMNEDLNGSFKLQPAQLSFRADSLLRIPTGTSSSDDYRSVIDDLTIQNKRLKRKLRKYEKLHDSHLQDDKLFEIRVHSLPPDKKKELKDMLHKFTMALGDASHAREADQSTGTNPAYDGFVPSLEVKKTSSSHASTRFGDSAYASVSASGQNSIAPSGQGSTQRAQHKRPKNAISHQQNQNIQSYLQDIPTGLMPQHTVPMTEKAKRKLVVRRLEQIFAGKEPAAGGHQQPLQQQEVAQSAARADRRAIKAGGQRARAEGAREARIMPKGKTGPANHMTEADIPRSLNPEIKAVDQGSEAPEQRPTRPLDLDPCRAQIPADNIEYIRHLGFSPVDAGSTAPQRDGRGWIYLNLLANMAQLHTINVTADFVRKSIADYSKKLELSSDGRKVRWRGGVDVTRTSSDSSPEDENRVSHSTRIKEPKKGSNFAIVSNDGSSENVPSLRQHTSSSSNNRDKLAYTPLFFHKIDSEDEDDLSDENMSGWSSPQAGFTNAANSSGFMSSGMRTTSSRKRRREDGPIIFYNKASFYTDLSGDPRCRNAALPNVTNYNRLSTDPMGARDRDMAAYQRNSEKRGPLSTLPGEPAECIMEINYSSSGDEMDIEMDSSKSKCSDTSSSEKCPNTIEFEASGLGGVLPRDNFTIRVKSRRKLIDDTCSSYASKEHRQSQRMFGIPPKIRTTLASRLAVTTPSTAAASASATTGSLVEEQILSSHRKDLPPSQLPPASFFPFGLPDEDEEDDAGPDENSGSDVANSEPSDARVVLLASRDRPLPAAAPQLMTWPAEYDSGSESEREDNSEDDDDGDDDEGEDGVETGENESMDLLRHARELDPSAVRVRERVYDANISERLAEEIPAGSSAATAGGGSGFNSPNNEREMEEREDGIGSGGGWVGVAEKGMTLKRARTSESVVGRVNKSPKVELQ